MPTISRFFGIVIRMHFNEHAPPHFHARYGEFRAQVAIGTLEVLRGKLPPRALALVLEWAAQYRSELAENWDRAARREALRPIPPLE